MKKLCVLILALPLLSACAPWDGGRIHDPALYPGPEYRVGEAEWDQSGGLDELMATEVWDE
jgi:hypothetical protein